jgi:hypothetical protein
MLFLFFELSDALYHPFSCLLQLFNLLFLLLNFCIAQSLDIL